MTKSRNNSPPQPWVMVLEAVPFKCLASSGPKCSAAMEGSGEMTSSLRPILESSAVCHARSRIRSTVFSYPISKKNGRL
jgi:hypothetical protein